ncbi:DUF4025 domain-containing protein [Paenibacillus doosanensis]|uniref:DUF4025 domain-containing protein n=1 Tax=Paenibacillus doosanensis TaxID=1229154 RepID=UPI00217FBF13|nr:DUF4025 domain-containing protein [Paenibacillus doosanensis]MCS7460420.1 DUF4025 domain-containing protein [Paenibacillus doosanensis]
MSPQSSQRPSAKQGQAVTKEQLNDVYAAGTSDGVVQLENGTMDISGSESGEAKRNENQ